MISAIGQYNVLERLGAGALGDVFRARDTRTGRTVALMVPPPELIASPARRGRFLEDARKAARLNHPNIAMLFDVVEQDDRCYLAYEFAAGPSLREEMGGAAVDVSHALHLAAHIADALAEGHANGIVHGDLRPDTIVVTPKGSVKVLNFGMTTWTKDREETLVTGYLSPEQALGTTVDPRSDLFALGVVLYQMLTGRQPFAAATADVTITNVLRQTPRRPSAVNRDLPAELDGIVMKLLAKEPDARYQTAAAIATDIRRVSSELDRRMNELLRRGVSLKRRRVLTGVAIAAAVILVLTHTAPAPGPFDAAVGALAVWHMPRTSPATVYLTYDDGPNAATTPLLLDVLARENARATFFLIDREITDRTVPLVARMFAEGHAVALHSDSRLDLLMSPAAFARKLTTNADRIERLTGHRPIRAFRPHAGWRSATMYAGLKRIDYRLIGWGWMRWDWNWYRTRTADATVDRVVARIEPGDIVVMHDGDVYNPGEDQRHTVEATARLIPLLRAKGYVFGRF